MTVGGLRSTSTFTVNAHAALTPLLVTHSYCSAILRESQYPELTHLECYRTTIVASRVNVTENESLTHVTVLLKVHSLTHGIMLPKSGTKGLSHDSTRYEVPELSEGSLRQGEQARAHQDAGRVCGDDGLSSQTRHGGPGRPAPARQTPDPSAAPETVHG